MAIQIELTVDEEAWLRQCAEERGEAPERLATAMLRALLKPPANGSTGKLPRVLDENGLFHEDRWERVLASIAEISANAPSLSAEALTRVALYNDHD